MKPKGVAARFRLGGRSDRTRSRDARRATINRRQNRNHRKANRRHE